jgi:hypothetical protein
LAGVLFLPAGIAVASVPNIALCEQANRDWAEHGTAKRMFKTTRSAAKEEEQVDDADQSGGAVATPAQSDCSTGTVTEAVAPIDDSGVASWLVTLVASEADDSMDDGSDSEDEDDSGDDESESDYSDKDSKSDDDSDDDSKSEAENCDDESDDNSESEDNSESKDDTESEDDTDSEDDSGPEEPEPKDEPADTSESDSERSEDEPKSEVKRAPAPEPKKEAPKPEPQTGTVPEPAPKPPATDRVRPGDQLGAVERSRQAAQKEPNAVVPAPPNAVVPAPGCNAANAQADRQGRC